MKTIILDTEMNGMPRQEICQLSYIMSIDGERSGRNFFFSVPSMNEYAQKKHGFSKYRLYELSGGRGFVQRFDEFFDDFMDVDLICGHNIDADLRVLKYSFADAGYGFPKTRTFCTMAHFDNAMHLKNKHGKHKPPRLDELCKYMRLNDEQIQKYCAEMFGKSAYRAHDARFDAAATCLCILEGQKRGDIRGVM